LLQQIKSFFFERLGLPPLAVFVLVGCIAHLGLNMLLRKSPTSAWGLLAPLLMGLVLESYEIWLQYGNQGLSAPGNDHVLLILARHGLDVVKMLAAPLLLVALGTVSSR